MSPATPIAAETADHQPSSTEQAAARLALGAQRVRAHAERAERECAAALGLRSRADLPLTSVVEELDALVRPSWTSALSAASQTRRLAGDRDASSDRRLTVGDSQSVVLDGTVGATHRSNDKIVEFQLVDASGRPRWVKPSHSDDVSQELRGDLAQALVPGNQIRIQNGEVHILRRARTLGPER